MPQIHVLDSETIDKIAAGEVVERPASVVKELVENAIDAGATAITVEAREGGINFIRVTDNGWGMEGAQLRTAFFRHATSKIKNADDLAHIASLGFRGEALSSIAAVSKVEVITKTAENLIGSRMTIEGGKEISLEEVGAPEGTTFLVRNLFFNMPVRRKFLKTPATEGGYIADLMEHLALSKPDISFKFVLGNQTRFHTSGNGDIKEVIYRIYGREMASALVPMKWKTEGFLIEGYLGKPVLVRSNRSFEIYFINGRFIKSTVIAKALEEGYKEYLMQHKFPFCVLHIGMDCEKVDVNVHPTKMDVRFSSPMEFSSILCEAVKTTLKNREMMPETVLVSEAEKKKKDQEARKAFIQEQKKASVPEPFEYKRSDSYKVMEESRYAASQEREDSITFADRAADGNAADNKAADEKAAVSNSAEVKIAHSREPAEKTTQLNLFTEKIFTQENRAKYHIIGQVFDTYWLIQFEDKLLIMDQHAAHEKVKYERLMRRFWEKNVISQRLLPPVIVSLTGQEEAVLAEHGRIFSEMGFEVEAFGGNEYALRSVPADLYGCSERELFLEVLDELGNGAKGLPKAVEEKIASMACKAAVKGNSRMTAMEALELIDELLTLDNPYNCPHGRPTIVTMSKTEMEKKFKRIV